MIVVLSHPENGWHECEQVNLLFEAGLQRFHVRKPHFSESEMRNYLNAIDPKNYPLLVIHQFHELIEEFNIHCVHFTAEARTKTSLQVLKNLNEKGRWLSTSIHDALEIKDVESVFDAAFICPIFDSISKPGYLGKSFDLDLLNQKRTIELIGLGGITSENSRLVLEMGLDGVALLGSIWNSLYPTNTFKKTRDLCTTIVQ